MWVSECMSEWAYTRMCMTTNNDCSNNTNNNNIAGPSAQVESDPTESKEQTTAISRQQPSAGSSYQPTTASNMQATPASREQPKTHRRNLARAWTTTNQWQPAANRSQMAVCVCVCVHVCEEFCAYIFPTAFTALSKAGNSECSKHRAGTMPSQSGSRWLWPWRACACQAHHDKWAR